MTIRRSCLALGLLLAAWLVVFPALARAAVMLTTTPSAAAVTLGTTSTTVMDSATLSGGNSPTGSMVFTLAGPGGFFFTQTDVVIGNGTYTASTMLPPTGAVTGTYQWSVTYLGDGNNSLVSDVNNPGERTVVSPANPSLSTSPNPTSVTVGGALPTLKDSASLSGGYFETGTITFMLVHNGSVVDTETVTVSGNGTYATPTGLTLPSSGQITGTYQWIVSYSGDANNHGAADSSEQVPVRVQPALSTAPVLTALTLGPAPSTLADSAVLSEGTSPTGKITFTLFRGTTLVDTETTTVSANGVYTTPTGYSLPATGTPVTGTYQWDATYSGDANNNAVSDVNTPNERVVVNAATPALSVRAPVAAALATPIGSSSVSGTLASGASPGATITFIVFGPEPAPPTSCVTRGTTVGTATVSGNGSYHPSAAFTPQSVGAYWWYARYEGDPNNNSVASNCGAGMPETIVGAPVPMLSGLKLSPRSFSLAGRKLGGRCVKPTKKNKRRPRCMRKVTLTARYTLNTATMVTFTITGSFPGRRVAGRCVTQTRTNRHHKKCTRHITLPGPTAKAGKAGANSFVLVRKLGPGSYTLTATPAGGAAQRITFKIVR